MSWWLLILASGTLGFTSGVDVFAGLVLGKVDVLPGYGAGTTPIDARYEPERFRRRLTISLVIFLFSALFFLIALFAILKQPAN